MSPQCESVTHYRHVPTSIQASVTGPQLQVCETGFCKQTVQEAANRACLAGVRLGNRAHAVVMNPAYLKCGRTSPELFPPTYSNLKSTLHST